MTYTAIPNSDIDAESIIDENMVTLLRDNPIAIVNGDPGAPKVRDGAIETTDNLGTIADDPVAGVIRATAKFFVVPSGAFPTLTLINTMKMGQSGIVRFFYRIDSPGTVYAQVFKNSIAYGTLNSGTGSYTEDVTFVKGDLLQLYGNCSSNGCSGDSISAVYLGTSSGILLASAWY